MATRKARPKAKASRRGVGRVNNAVAAGMRADLRRMGVGRKGMGAGGG